MSEVEDVSILHNFYLHCLSPNGPSSKNTSAQFRDMIPSELKTVKNERFKQAKRQITKFRRFYMERRWMWVYRMNIQIYRTAVISILKRCIRTKRDHLEWRSLCLIVYNATATKQLSKVEKRPSYRYAKLIKHYGMKTHGGVDIEIHVILTSTLVSFTQRLYYPQGGKVPGKLCTGGRVGPANSKEDVQRRKSLAPLEHEFRPVRCTDCVIQAVSWILLQFDMETFI